MFSIRGNNPGIGYYHYEAEPEEETGPNSLHYRRLRKIVENESWKFIKETRSTDLMLFIAWLERKENERV